MSRGKNKRDLKEELDNLKKKAENEFRSIKSDGSANGFLNRASKIPIPGGSEREKFQAIREKRSGCESGGGRAFRKGEKFIMAGMIRKSRVAGKTSEVIHLSSPRVKIEDAVPGRVEEYGGGEFLRLLNSASSPDLQTDRLAREYLAALSSVPDPDLPAVKPMEILAKLQPNEVCFLDLETTGLSNSPLFLAGLMYLDGDKMYIDQFFARDYTEEPFLLAFADDFLGRFKALVTFNGICFDIPFIRERMAVAGIDFKEPAHHVDLLPISRRIVGGRTPNHKLSTLEVHVLGRKRIDDIPGYVIPDLYHEFVRTGNAANMAGVIRHNRIDLISMMRLIVVFLSGRIGVKDDTA